VQGEKREADNMNLIINSFLLLLTFSNSAIAK